MASKTFLVEPTNSQAGAPYTVTLYYTQTEVNDYLAATGKNISDVKVVRYNAQINTVTPPATGTEISNTEIVALMGASLPPILGPLIMELKLPSRMGFLRMDYQDLG